MKETITQRSPVVRNYTYYSNSSRLKSNEKYTFEYDANGNLTKKETLIGEKVIWKYEYDLFNRLVKVKKNDSVVAEYMYDEAGLRIKKTSPDSAIYYVFDTGGMFYISRKVESIYRIFTLRINILPGLTETLIIL
jgi:YD repeat-containing protein